MKNILLGRKTIPSTTFCNSLGKRHTICHFDVRIDRNCYFFETFSLFDDTIFFDIRLFVVENVFQQNLISEDSMSRTH